MDESPQSSHYIPPNPNMFYQRQTPHLYRTCRTYRYIKSQKLRTSSDQFYTAAYQKQYSYQNVQDAPIYQSYAQPSYYVVPLVYVQNRRESVEYPVYSQPSYSRVSQQRYEEYQYPTNCENTKQDYQQFRRFYDTYYGSKRVNGTPDQEYEPYLNTQYAASEESLKTVESSTDFDQQYFEGMADRFKKYREQLCEQFKKDDINMERNSNKLVELDEDALFADVEEECRKEKIVPKQESGDAVTSDNDSDDLIAKMDQSGTPDQFLKAKDEYLRRRELYKTRQTALAKQALNRIASANILIKNHDHVLKEVIPCDVIASESLPTCDIPAWDKKIGGWKSQLEHMKKSLSLSAEVASQTICTNVRDIGTQWPMTKIGGADSKRRRTSYSSVSSKIDNAGTSAHARKALSDWIAADMKKLRTNIVPKKKSFGSHKSGTKKLAK